MHSSSSLIPGRFQTGFVIPGLAALLAACAGDITQPASRDATLPAAASISPAVASSFTGCRTGPQPGGALWEICVPPVWNGDVVTWAHGYQQPDGGPELPNDAVSGVPVKDIVQGLHYAYAASSYRHKGLVADVASQDLDELPGIVRTQTGADPGHFYLVGASEGSLSAILSLQRAGTPFDGALAVCGPLGSFRGQVNWFGDFRAAFDYFFPGVLPGDVLGVNDAARAHWDPDYINAIAAAMAASPGKTVQLLHVTGAPVDAADPTSAVQTAVAILWYNFFAAADAVYWLHGNPFDNSHKWYTGSANDLLLNLRIRRYHASATALAGLSSFETSGVLRRVAVAAHTTGDPVVPYWQQPLYQVKTVLAGSALQLVAFPVGRYGHCTFTESEVLGSFALLVLRVSFRDLIASASVFHGESEAQEFMMRARQQGAAPRVMPERDLVSAMLRR